jgi:hypothetical protein
MRPRTTSKRGRRIPVLLAAAAGYLIGGWQSPALRSFDLSAAQSIALRFPQAWNDASLNDASAAATTSAPLSAAAPALQGVAASGLMAQDQRALFSPEPMVPRAMPQTASAKTPQATLQIASLEQTGSNISETRATPAAATAAPVRRVKVSPPATHRTANRPSHLLDDVQIASIKERLHLTPDQEAMWPAVEAALRNIAYAKAQQDSRRGSAGATQLASIDPNSNEVQDLKSAAVPLIMSFNDEQKDEVRNLAHVMGLDQLAAQF